MFVEDEDDADDEIPVAAVLPAAAYIRTDAAVDVVDAAAAYIGVAVDVDTAAVVVESFQGEDEVVE